MRGRDWESFWEGCFIGVIAYYIFFAPVAWIWRKFSGRYPTKKEALVSLIIWYFAFCFIAKIVEFFGRIILTLLFG